MLESARFPTHLGRGLPGPAPIGPPAVWLPPLRAAHLLFGNQWKSGRTGRSKALSAGSYMVIIRANKARSISAYICRSEPVLLLRRSSTAGVFT